jgi:methylthioribose-1-phosphate isomerase
LGRVGASVLKDGDTILTHCWPETTLIYTLMEALSQGKSLKAYTGETRPYLQGARLTAAALRDLGIPVTVITDNMPGFLLSQGKIDVFFAGSDRTTMDGHVINKVGTLQIAICAKEYGVPFYAFAYGPDPQALRPEDVVIEERNPEEVLSLRGIPTAAPGVFGYYPAFDITPPKFITGIITDRGIFPPDKIRDYFL